MIPMLPLKLIDFIESPVPILAGLPLDCAGKGWDVNSLLNRCRQAIATIQFGCIRVFESFKLI